jgi:MFS family permease
MAAAGIVFASTHVFIVLLIAGTLGVISPSGNEVGPFLSVEQAALSHVVPGRLRTEIFAWYTLAGAVATAAGALAAGAFANSRAVIILYALLGGVLAVLFSVLSGAAEVAPSADKPTLSGLHRSKAVVAKLSALFALDSFAGGFVMQSFAAYWFYLRWNVAPKRLGAIFFGANLLAGLSALVASRIAKKFGLIRTMVVTHLPSNVLLILVPLMPTLPLAIIVLLLRFSISQMDVPTRQAYTMAVVEADERSAAAGITGVARTTGAAISPFLVGMMFARPSLINLPFILGGSLKIVYDLLVWWTFSRVPVPED